ncbi:methyl-accepting chemotaxis protein [uncultured Paludibaculum sp.]|uniref:methyl-accepting chemotaxis protein n=1 Tax=uncultured Paludibaculum sp. TaxID=1765020 RepID=UPI002AAB505D|nr:methyl-accepting chemotaxis protein [uncultured Paludibaculum sp.]
MSQVVHRSEVALGIDSAAPQWILDLTEVVEDLRGINRVTEADFLAVGGKLMGFLSSARGIRADISELATCIAGDAGERLCGALSTVLSRSIEMKGCVEETARTLDSIRLSADKMHQCFSRFDEIVLSFQVVATLGRIETARIGGSHLGLGHFADEVRSYSESIRKCVEHALGEAAELECYIGRAIQHISEGDSQQLAAIPSLVGAIEEVLGAFRLRQQEASATSLRLADEFTALSETINGLVEALQFHDITRQQVEHVIESLEDLLNDARHSVPTACPLPEVVAVVDLQRQQLLGAAKTFESSVQRVNRELKQVAALGHKMVAETRTLLGLVTEDQQSSFFPKMERAFAGVLSAIASCCVANDDTVRTQAELRHTISGLQGCLDDLRVIWRRINRLAINATIEAVHLGPAGEPLSVVAGSMQTLYLNAEKRSGETEDSLANLRSAVMSIVLGSNDGPAASEPSANASIVDELKARVDELHASSERSVAYSKRIGAVSATLYSDVRSASEGFAVGDLVAETLDRTCGTLQRITAASDIDAVHAARGLEHLAAQYTMLAEREVHERATATVFPAPSNEEMNRRAATAPPGDLGDGVELF